MRTIHKKREPGYLIGHRKQGSFNLSSDEKSELSRRLVDEQRGLCCYCMVGIGTQPGEMKIEHWRSQTKYPAERASYQNLLAACLGGEGRARQLQHCDTYKRDADLKWNPADRFRNIENRIFYELDGTVRSTDEEFDTQLCSVLNLNIAELKNRRDGVLAGLKEWRDLKIAKTEEEIPLATLEGKRVDLTDGDGRLGAYCQVAVWWLGQWIKGQM